MSIVKVISSQNAGANLNYLINEKAHDTSLTSHRTLKFAGQNVFGDYANKVNARYLADQYWAVRQRANNPNKKVQVYHLIFSFSQQEFNPSKQNLIQQASQALKLVNDFLHRLLPSTAQYLEAVQCDSKGKNLHVHVSCNSVLTNGKVLNTNIVSVNSRTITKNKKQLHYPGIRNQFDNFMTNHFEKLTGHEFHPVKPDKVNLVNPKTVKIDERGGYIWKEELKSRILDAFNNTDNYNDFEAVLEANNGVKIKHRRAAIGKNNDGKKIYRDAVTYYFTDENLASHSARDFAYTKSGATRGLGLSFTPQAIQHEFKKRKEQTKEQKPIKQTTSIPSQQTLSQQRLLLQQQINLLANTKEQKYYDYQSSKSLQNVTSINFKPIDTKQADEQLQQRKELQLERQRQEYRQERQQRSATKPANSQQPKYPNRRSTPNHQESNHPQQRQQTAKPNYPSFQPRSFEHYDGPSR